MMNAELSITDASMGELGEKMRRETSQFLSEWIGRVCDRPVWVRWPRTPHEWRGYDCAGTQRLEPVTIPY